MAAISVLFLLLLIVLVGWIIWVVSAKTFIVVRTQSGTILSTGTSTRERAAAEELYAMITNESINTRQRLGGLNPPPTTSGPHRQGPAGPGGPVGGQPGPVHHGFPPPPPHAR